MNIDEFAKIANVAKSSISKALNGKQGVSEKTRQRILELAKEYDFQPNQSAQALAKNKTNCIAFLLTQEASSITSDYWTGIMTTISGIAAQQGYSLMIVTPSSSPKEISTLLNPLVKRHAFDGLIIGAEQLSEENINLFKKEKLSFVFIGTNPDSNFYSIGVNSITGSKTLVSELIKNDCKNIGCISGPSDFIYNKERVLGFKEALEESGLDNSKIIVCSYNDDDVYNNAVHFFQENRDLDSIFITAGGDFALKIFKAMKKIYGDISNIKFAIFDYTPYFDITDLHIITARQPLKEIGTKAFSTLFKLMNNQTPEEKKQLLNVEIFKQ